MSTNPSPGSLGNLAQSARTGQLRTARVIMFIVGGLTIAMNGFGYFTAEKIVDDAIQNEVEKVQQQGLVVDPTELSKIRGQAITLTRVFSGVGLAVGVVFIVLGLFVYQMPVAATVTALVLYVGMYALVGYFDPSQLYRGLIIKILIVVGLFKSIQAAIAYRQEQG